MPRFLLKLALYALPFLIPLLLLTGFMLYTGESLPLRIVADMQVNEPIVYRPRYGNRDLAFKTLSANLRQSAVLSAGSSRVLQFRAQFFNRQPDQFYNVGAPAWTLDQVEQLLHDLTFTPRILILGLDQVWFNDAYNPDVIDPPMSDFAHIDAVNRAFLHDVLIGEQFNIPRYLARVEPGEGGLALGLRAIRDGHGFRSDGSEQYGDFLVARWLDPQTERQRHLDYLRDGAEMYVEGDTVSQSRLAQLAALLDWCDERGIVVVGFLPSFTPTLYQQMSAGGNHTYIQQLDAVLQPMFEQYGFAYFNFSDGASLGATDADFFDGWHASERIYLRLYQQMLAARPDLLGAYSDPAFLAAADASTTDTFRVFGNSSH